MQELDYLTEDEVIQGVAHYLLHKGKTSQKRVVVMADTQKKAHGVDLKIKLENDQKRGNLYFIEAKGNKRADGSKMRSSWNTNFRWAISQIILRMNVDSRRNNYIYGIAVPNAQIKKCIELIENNWALKHLKLRLYGVYWENGQLTAKEYCPKDIYKDTSRGQANDT